MKKINKIKEFATFVYKFCVEKVSTMVVNLEEIKPFHFNFLNSIEYMV